MLPSFTTERLLLRPRIPADNEACFAMDRAPGVTRFVNGPWGDEAAHRAFIEARTLGPYPEGMGYWSVFLRAAPTQFVGWILLIPVDAVGPAIEIGWRLAPESWGQGLATEAARPVLAHAFGAAQIGEVVADIDRENAASRRVAEKLGLKLAAPVEHDGRVWSRYALRWEAFESAREADLR